MAFTTRDKVKTALGIPLADTTHDARIDDLVAGVEAWLLALFGLTDTDPTSYAYDYDVDDGETYNVKLLSYPVISVDEVRFDGTAQDLTKFYLRNPKGFGLLRIKSGEPFPFGNQVVGVTHTAGWATVPGDLARLATALVVGAFNTDPHSGFESERIGQYQYRLAGAGGADGGGGGSSLQGLLTMTLGAHLRPFPAGA